MKLAILEADILYDALRPTYVGYGLMVQDLMRQAGLDWELTVYPVISGQYPLSFDSFDACLITGSKYDSFADDAWIARLRDYARKVFALNKPLVGICFGHQLLAHALGGRSGRSDAGWGLGISRYQLEHITPFMDRQDKIDLIVSHQDQVHALPEQAVRLWSNDFCPNAAFYIPRKVLAVQGHPEFTVAYAKDLLQFRADQFDPDFLNEVRATLTLPHDGMQVATWIRRFLEDSVTGEQ